MNEIWEEPKEEDGLTLGPEEALQREIEKSKTLKVEKLRLKDEIANLKDEKNDLVQKNQELRERLSSLDNSETKTGKKTSYSLNKLIIALVIVFLALLWIISRN